MRTLLAACVLVLISCATSSAQTYVQIYRPVFMPTPVVTFYGPTPNYQVAPRTTAFYSPDVPVTAYYTPGSFRDPAAVPMTTVYVQESVLVRPGAVGRSEAAVYRNGTAMTPPGFLPPVMNVHPRMYGPSW